jgi:DNA polymerase-3 subunit delta'
MSAAIALGGATSVDDGTPLDDGALWATVVGQESAVALLRRAAANPVHAYLLVGPPGAGRTEAARAFAGSLIAGRGEDAAAGRHRGLAAAGRHPDLILVEPEGRSLLVADAERITVEGWRSPIETDRKVVLVDRFDTAEPSAAASLLKTIEEPPDSVVFVLLAEEVPEEHVTIASRCVRVDLPPVPAPVVAEALVADGIPAERATELAEAAAGSVARARLLASDPAFLVRRDAWHSVPDRLDGSGAAVVVLVAELRDLIDAAQTPLEARHRTELEMLTEREEAFGTRGSGRRELADRQKREVRRHRDDELRFGLATLSRVFLTRSVPDGPAPAEAFLSATDRITEATGDLVRNPNEALLLQALLLDLPTVQSG